jgi:hypothetical protein
MEWPITQTYLIALSFMSHFGEIGLWINRTGETLAYSKSRPPRYSTTLQSVITIILSLCLVGGRSSSYMHISYVPLPRGLVVASVSQYSYSCFVLVVLNALVVVVVTAVVLG